MAEYSVTVLIYNMAVSLYFLFGKLKPAALGQETFSL